MPVFTDYPTFKGSSLSDLLGTVQGVQQFQQQQQLMPLQLEKAQLELERQRQTQEPEIGRSKELFEQSKIATKKNKYELDAKQAEDVLSGFGALAASDEIKNAHKGKEQQDAAHMAILDMKKNLENKGIDPLIVDAYTNKLTNVAMENPHKLHQALKNIINMGQSTQQFSQLNAPPTGVSTGSYQNLVPTSPYQTDRKVLSFKQELGPNQLYVPTGRVDAENDPTAYVYSADGTLLGEQKIPSGVNPQANVPANTPPVPAGAPSGIMPQSNAVARLAPYETTDTVNAARLKQAQSNDAAKGVALTQFNNNQIIKLADQTLTGAGAQALAKLGGGYAAIPFTTNEADNLQKLGHFMALETANLAASSGLGTDAARNLASQVSGDITWTKDAIKSTARINRALSTSTELFNQGLNKSIAAAKNNPLAGRDFTNKWSTAADINTIRLMDAVRNNDTDEIKGIVDSLGGPNSKGYQELLLKAGTLNKLVKGQ